MARGDEAAETGTLTRADLADVVHKRIGLSRSESSHFVERTLHHLCAALSNGENVKLSGFGSFLLRDKGERVGRNPKTGVEVPIAPPPRADVPREPDVAQRGLQHRVSEQDRQSSTRAPRAVSLKDDAAFRTISELAAELGVPQHILRYWETRFPQLRPLQRAGNRRYYRPADAALARRIHTLLEHDHYTIKGVQRLLVGKSAEPEVSAAAQSVDAPVAPVPQMQHAGVSPDALRRVRTLLTEALAADEA